MRELHDALMWDTGEVLWTALERAGLARMEHDEQGDYLQLTDEGEVADIMGLWAVIQAHSDR